VPLVLLIYFFAIHQLLSQVAEPFQGPLTETLQQPGRRQRRKATEVHSAEILSTKKDAAIALNQQVIGWLKGQAADDPGFQGFQAGRKKILANPDIVKSWKFIAAFANKHFGSVLSPVCLITC
jgi:hypothetical protein